MTKPSKGAAVFVAFFGLMFLVPGLLAFLTLLTNGRTGGASGAVAGSAIALFISAIGGGLVFAAFAGYGRSKKQAAVEEANPSSPWLWRADWANSRADSRHKKSQITAWVICIFYNTVFIPVAAANVSQMVRRNDPRLFLIIGFFLIGVLLFAVALRASLRHRRYGNAYLEFDALPFSPGGRLAGRIHLKLDADASHGIDLRLSCFRNTVTGSGNNRSTVQAVLWQADRNVPAGAIGSDPLGRTIPVDFTIPADAYVTDQDNPSDQVVWLLHAHADVPGVDYSDDFDLPVFRTSASPAPSSFAASSDASGFASASPSDADTAAAAAPAHPKVILSSQEGGTEFYFHAFRSPARALILLAFTVVWSGVVYFLFRSSAPWLFAVVFGGFDLLLVLGVLHSVLGTARIRVGNGEIISITRILGIGKTRRFPISEIEAVVPVTSGQQSNSQRSAVYAIRLRTKDGRRVTLADDIDSRQEARWIVSQIESLAGLKVDTRVEVTAPFGAPSQPPQPAGGSMQLRTDGAGWPQQRPPSLAAKVLPLVAFSLFVGGMFTWQALRFASLKPVAGASRAKASRPAGAAVPAPRHFAKPMTDADAVRVLALPMQDQAEELLERAIGHDPRALELFEAHVEGWIGHIHLTERMKQLERRSEFSSDLRVRYANADINLTLDGWQKNEQAADMLIARARTDPKYRAAAVYFLGMLAGRGVAYEKIHAVLLEYAKHDPDAYVRQWAVEGMRYLGKDEALDELFESFTEDPSFNVRDRAGCNLSDCGNFTRAQRIRMVPKFLELVSNPSTSGQMRNWSFLALHEITDENLPASAQAWQTWYGLHGPEKVAEFEQQEWWQVRGDE